MKIPFKNRIVIIGCGGTSRCLQQLLLNHLEINFSRVTLVDSASIEPEKLPLIAHGAQFIQQTVTKENYKKTLKALLHEGDLLIDLAVNLNTEDLVHFCQKRGVLFLNAAMHLWPDEIHHLATVAKKTLYRCHQKLENHAQEWPKNGPTAVIEHGVNPGLVNHWVKKGLMDVAHAIIERTGNEQKKQQLQQTITSKNFPRLAQLTNTRVIHIAQRDSQITNNPKKMDEFVHSSSIPGLALAASSPAEFGWGSHEKKAPKYSQFPRKGPLNEVFIKQTGMSTFVRSWSPSGPFFGMLVRNGGTYTISNHLTIRDKNKITYRPTVLYSYLPNDSAYASLHEFKMHNYILPNRQRCLGEDIIEGMDEQGVLLLGHDLNGWWIGSRLSILEARSSVEHYNVSALQAAAGLLSALKWIIKHPQQGLCMPDDLPYDEILHHAQQYLGVTVSLQTDWTPLHSHVNPLYTTKVKSLSGDDLWQFNNFLVD